VKGAPLPRLLRKVLDWEEGAMKSSLAEASFREWMIPARTDLPFPLMIAE
jgi:hypothetical protein